MMPLPQLLMGFLATYLVHSTLFVAVAWISTRRRRLSPAWRETLWKTAIIAGLVTSMAAQAAPWTVLRVPLPGTLGTAAETSFSPGPPVSYEREATLAGEETRPVLALPPTEAADPRRFRSWTWSTLLGAAWLVTSSLLLVRLVWRRRRLRDAFRERDAVEDPALLTILREVRAASGFTGHLRLTAAASVPCPMALSAHEICVPKRFLTDLDRAEQRAALAHELAHLVRGDIKWLVGAMVLECVFFVQPLQRLARHEVRDAFERLADEWAVRLVGDRASLATCLVRVATWQTSLTTDLGDALAMTGKGSPLGDRVRCLLEGKPELEPSVALRWAGALMFVLGVGGLAPVVGDAAPARTDLAEDLASPPRFDAVIGSSARPPRPNPGPPSITAATDVPTAAAVAEPASGTLADPTGPLPAAEAGSSGRGFEQPVVQTVPIDLALAPGRVPDSPVRVESERRPIRPVAATASRSRLVGPGQALGRAATDETTLTVRTSDLFRTMVGVQALCDDIRCRLDARRGFAGFDTPDVCELQYFLDGLPWTGGIPDLAVESIESIEVYNGASQLPPQFHGPNAICGVVAIWTRP